MIYYSINLLDPRNAQTVAVCEGCGSLVYDTVAHDADHELNEKSELAYTPLPGDPEANLKITEPLPPTPVSPLPKTRATKATET